MKTVTKIVPFYFPHSNVEKHNDFKVLQQGCFIAVSNFGHSEESTLECILLFNISLILLLLLLLLVLLLFLLL